MPLRVAIGAEAVVEAGSISAESGRECLLEGERGSDRLGAGDGGCVAGVPLRVQAYGEGSANGDRYRC
jgi:hypothetical protein